MVRVAGKASQDSSTSWPGTPNDGVQEKAGPIQEPGVQLKQNEETGRKRPARFFADQAAPQARSIFRSNREPLREADSRAWRLRHRCLCIYRGA